MLNVVYIATARIPTEKAYGYQVAQMCQAFSESGAHVRLWVPLKKGEAPVAAAEFLHYYNLRTHFDLEYIATPNILAFAARIGLRRAQVQLPFFLLDIFIYAMKLRRMIRSLSSDTLIYLRDVHFLSFLIPWIPKERLQNFVLEVHALPEKKNRMKRQIRVMQKMKRIVCLTHAMREILLKEGLLPEVLTVESDCVDLDSFRLNCSQLEARQALGLDPKAFYASYVGRFVTNGMEKGLPEIIASAKYLQQGHGIRFLFVGGPLDRVGAYKAQIAQLGIDAGMFEFVDKVPVKDVPLYLKASNVLLMPHPANNEFYSFYVSPLKLFEYMSAEKPIIASRLPAIMEILHHERNALLCEAGNPQDIAKALQRLVDDQELNRLLANQAARDVNQYSWLERAKRILRTHRGPSQVYS